MMSNSKQMYINMYSTCKLSHAPTLSSAEAVSLGFLMMITPKSCTSMRDCSKCDISAFFCFPVTTLDARTMRSLSGHSPVKAPCLHNQRAANNALAALGDVKQICATTGGIFSHRTPSNNSLVMQTASRALFSHCVVHYAT